MEFLCIVPAGQRVVIFDRLKGIRAKPMEEGTHFLIPWLQKPIFFDVRLQSKVITTNTGSKGTISLLSLQICNESAFLSGCFSAREKRI